MCASSVTCGVKAVISDSFAEPQIETISVWSECASKVVDTAMEGQGRQANLSGAYSPPHTLKSIIPYMKLCLHETSLLLDISTHAPRPIFILGRDPHYLC